MQLVVSQRDANLNGVSIRAEQKYRGLVTFGNSAGG